MRLQGEEQRAADPDRGDDAEAQQHLARKPRHARPLRPQPHLLCDPRAAVPTRSLVLRCVGHDCGLPSVRTMRTFF